MKTDSDKYRVVLENDRVRVLEYRDKPGEKTTMHAHPDFVVLARSALKNAHSHIGENIGDTDTDVLIIELKEPRKPETGGTKQQ